MPDGPALVTGGDQPLGAAIAERLSAAAVTVVIGGADGDRLAETADRIDAPALRPVRADPRDEFDLERLAETASREGAGRLGAVIPAARVRHGDGAVSATEASYAAVDDELRTNLRGVLATVREAMPHCDGDTRIVVPVGDDAGVGTFATGEHAIRHLVAGIAATAPLPILAVDVGGALAGDGAVDRGAAAVEAALARPRASFDGRTLEGPG